jgi:hypothetical protein
MKMPLKKLCALIAILCISISASAYNFEVDGIYYNITSDSTCSVTYKTGAYNSYHGDVNIPKSIIHNDINYTITKIDWYAFKNCDELKSVTIPNTVTSICKEAFCWSSIKKAVIPNSVTEIGDEAFCGCHDLSSVSIPDKISVIGNDLFNSCYSLTSISIPNSVTSIGERAFRGTGLTSVTIPNSVTSIGERAFWDCLDRG